MPNNLVLSAATASAISTLAPLEWNTGTVGNDSTNEGVVDTAQAIKLMSNFAMGKVMVNETNGYSTHRNGMSLSLCRYCYGGRLEDGYSYYYCKSCDRCHCEPCDEKTRNNIDYKSFFKESDRKEIEFCYTHHGASWEKRKVSQTIYPGYKYNVGDHSCDGCNQQLDAQVESYFNLKADKDYCLQCVAAGDPNLIVVQSLKKYDPLMTRSEYYRECADLVPKANEWEARDGVGSLLNWVPVFAERSIHNGRNVTEWIAVNCNPESPLYDRVCAFLWDGGDDGYECFTVDGKTIAEMMTEMKGYGNIRSYIYRNRYRYSPS